ISYFIYCQVAPGDNVTSILALRDQGIYLEINNTIINELINGLVDISRQKERINLKLLIQLLLDTVPVNVELDRVGRSERKVVQGVNNTDGCYLPLNSLF